MIESTLAEEIYDRKIPFYLALLDAKSAFYVVDLHVDILTRMLFLLGVHPSTWKIINELH